LLMAEQGYSVRNHTDGVGASLVGWLVAACKLAGVIDALATSCPHEFRVLEDWASIAPLIDPSEPSTRNAAGEYTEATLVSGQRVKGSPKPYLGVFQPRTDRSSWFAGRTDLSPTLIHEAAIALGARLLDT